MVRLEGALRAAAMDAYERFQPVRRRYQEAGIDPERAEFLHQLPTISKQDLAGYGLPELVATDMIHISRIFTSTGTNGQMGIVALTAEDWRRQVEILRRATVRMGGTARDILYDMIPRTTLFAAYVGLHAWQEIGAAVIPAGQQEMAKHLALIDRLKPTALLGIAHFMYDLGCRLPVELKRSIRLVVVVGEVLSAQTRRRLAEVFDSAEIYSGFGISEVMTACECPVRHGFHLETDEVFAEVLNPDENGVGELTYTSLHRQAMPLIRYRSGDLGRIIADPCPCGDKTPRFEVFGRVDGMANIKGKLVDLNQLKQVVLGTKGVAFARAYYRPGADVQFEIHYAGAPNEEELRKRVRLAVGVTPVLRRQQQDVSQWKEQFFVLLADGSEHEGEPL